MRGTSGKRSCKRRQAEVFGAEVVSPLRHAVRFVDGEQRDAGLFEQAQEARREQALGRDVQQFELPCRECALDLHGGARRRGWN